MKKLLFVVLLLSACNKTETIVQDAPKEMYCVRCQKQVDPGVWSDTLYQETYCADQKGAQAYLDYKNSGTLYRCWMVSK